MYNPHEDIYNEVNWKNLFTPPKKEKKKKFPNKKNIFTQTERTITTATTTPSRQKSHLILFLPCAVQSEYTQCSIATFAFVESRRFETKKKSSFRARDQHTRELMLLLFWPAFNLLPSFSYFYFIFFPHHSRKLKLLSLKRGTRTYKSKRHVYMKKTRLLCCSN